MDALTHGGFGEADQDGLWQTGGGVDFDLNGHGFDADEGEGGQLGEHAGNPRLWATKGSCTESILLSHRPFASRLPARAAKCPNATISRRVNPTTKITS